MRLKDKEELLLGTRFSTALSGEAVSPIRFWADAVSLTAVYPLLSSMKP